MSSKPQNGRSKRRNGRTGKSHPSWVTPEYREHMAEIGRAGGKSRSSRKKKASKKNLKKALQAKFPRAARYK